MSTQESTPLDLLQQIETLLEDTKQWDGSQYSYGLVYPHKYVPLLEKLKVYLRQNESLE